MAGRQVGFWDIEHRLRELSRQGDLLEKLAATVDFEVFRPDLEAALRAPDPGRCGRIAPGAPANLVLFRMGHYSELLSRPQTDRWCCVPAGRSARRRPITMSSTERLRGSHG